MPWLLLYSRAELGMLGLMEEAGVLISIDDITVQVGEQRWFAHTTWQIEANQSWAIFGPTGSGKTTLVKALRRVLPLAGGKITYFFDADQHPQGRSTLKPGEILTFSAESHRDFLRPFATYHQARWQSFEGEAAPTVSSLLGMDGVTSPQPGQIGLRVRDEIIHQLKLGPLLERKILHLSHGESRKVLIARLWMSQPRLLVLDDPYTGLDAETRAIFARAIDALVAAGSPPVLLVTSRAEEIPVSIRCVVRVEGQRVTALGERQTVLARQGPVSTVRHPTQVAGAAPNAVFGRMLAQYTTALSANPVLQSSELIRMDDVSVRYGGVDVLKNLSWRVARGERWALTGHNGAGKTTLLSLIMGDNPQSYANAITLFGRRRGSGESIWEIKQNIGWVSPELHIYYPHTATCLDVVSSGFFDSVGLYRRPSGEQSRQAAGWLGAFGMDGQAEAPFHALSTGQQRLVLLARALVKNPPVLILDEPCQGLDEDHRRQFTSLLDRLCAFTPLTLIYVSHYAEEIPTCVTHQLVLEGGEPV
jgi:molybdate transport system ATP-binding protein